MVGPRITAMANPNMIKSFDEAMKLTVADMKKMTAKVDTLFVRTEKRLFATEGASGGRPWKKLKKATRDAKRRAGLSKKIMQRTGELRRGLTVKGHPDHVAKWANLGSDARIEMGVQSILPVYHGAVRGQRNPRLPRRSVFQITAPQRRAYFQVVTDQLVSKLRRGLRFMKTNAAFNAFRRGAA